jgi:hypothetical protein
MVLVNGVMVRNHEPLVHSHEYIQSQMGMGRRVSMINPETVGKYVDDSAERFARSLQMGSVEHILGGYPQKGSALGNGDGGALALVEMARKATKGDEQAKQKLKEAMHLENAMLRPDWIERLANNTNLETRATVIIEAKREKERQERERREQQNR